MMIMFTCSGFFFGIKVHHNVPYIYIFVKECNEKNIFIKNLNILFYLNIKTWSLKFNCSYDLVLS